MATSDQTISKQENLKPSSHDAAVLNSREYDAAAEETLKEADSTWAVLKQNPRAVSVMMAVLLNGIIVGIELNMAGNMLGIQSFCRQFGFYNTKSELYEISAHINSVWFAASIPFQLLGMIASGTFGDIFGRRPVLYGVLVFCVAGSALESFATTWQGWLGAKIVMCFVTGLMQAGVSTYISEVSPRELRGVSLSTFNMFMNMGNLFSTIIAWATAKRWPNPTDDRGFRVPLYLCMALPFIIFVALICLLVESPGWLVLRGRQEKAIKSLRWLYPQLDEDGIALKLAEIKYTITNESEAKNENRTTSWIDCFRGVDARRSFCAVFPALAQPLCGNMLCGPLATYFFSLAGASNALASAAIVLSVGFVCNIGTYFVLDNKRIGRWTVLFSGLFLMFLGNMGIGIVGTIQPEPKNSKPAGALIQLFVCILAIGSVTGPGAAGWTYTGESGSARLRAKTNTLGNLGNASIAWVMASTISYMLQPSSSGGFGLKVGFFYAGLAVISLVIVYFFIPDFTGRSFAQIDELFLRRISASKFARTVCTGGYGSRDITAKSVEGRSFAG